MAGYLENGLAGSSCPAGWTMGQGYDSHEECEWCSECVHRLCGALCSGGVRRS
jgi:hypothetical protein